MDIGTFVIGIVRDSIVVVFLNRTNLGKAGPFHISLFASFFSISNNVVFKFLNSFSTAFVYLLSYFL